MLIFHSCSTPKIWPRTMNVNHFRIFARYCYQPIFWEFEGTWAFLSSNRINYLELNQASKIDFQLASFHCIEIGFLSVANNNCIDKILNSWNLKLFCLHFQRFWTILHLKFLLISVIGDTNTQRLDSTMSKHTCSVSHIKVYCLGRSWE